MGSTQDLGSSSMQGSSKDCHDGQPQTLSSVQLITSYALQSEELLGHTAPRTLGRRDDAARSLSSGGHVAQAILFEEETLRRRLSLKKPSDAFEDDATLDNRMRLARHYSDTKDSTKAVRHLRAVLRVLKESPAQDWNQISEVCNELVIELWKRGEAHDIHEAIDISTKALSQAVPFLGHGHPTLIDLRHNMGERLMGLHKLEAASKCFQENKDILEAMDPGSRESHQLNEALADTVAFLEICQKETIEMKKRRQEDRERLEKEQQENQLRLAQQEKEKQRLEEEHGKQSQAKQKKDLEGKERRGGKRRAKKEREFGEGEHIEGMERHEEQNQRRSQKRQKEKPAEGEVPVLLEEPFVTGEILEKGGNSTRNKSNKSKGPTETLERLTTKGSDSLVNESSKVPSSPGGQADGVFQGLTSMETLPKTKMPKARGKETHLQVPGSWSPDFDIEFTPTLEVPKERLHHTISATDLRPKDSDRPSMTAMHDLPSRPASMSEIERPLRDSGGDGVSQSDRFFKNLEDKTHSLLDKYKDRMKDMNKDRKRVKIAILDTGIARNPSSVEPQVIADAKARIKFGRPLETLSPREDENGHGTHCAGLLLRVCPYAEVHVYRISRGLNDPNDPIKPNVVAAALHHAVTDRKVDVISMSFGWNEDNSQELREALEYAKQQKVLLFAAASNEGGDMAFPARADEVIAIDAAAWNGKPLEFNPRGTGYQQRFTALGEGVISAWPLFPGANMSGLKRMTGTSFATPIAASTAALIIEFARQPPLCFDPEIERYLKDLRGMRHVLRSAVCKKTEVYSEFTHIDITALLHTNRLYEDGGPWDDQFSQRAAAANTIVRSLSEEFGLDVLAKWKASIAKYQRSHPLRS
ncbi:hypothetical protein SLS56_000503 [Neofusicoccum ribis]|uniref:Peptidase S8/S53 domain-containing protein n=1 Tax=Neofusicoccum ribis TaxID=45134 RepID=A0ABR3TES7_9PEZI